MGEDARHLVDAAVDGDDRNAGVDRLLERRRHGVDVVRADDDAVDALGDRGLDVGGLLGRAALAVALDDVDVAELLPPRPSICFIMWTKNGKASCGIDARIVSSFC